MAQNSGKIILDLCGGTGAWSKPYKDNGYDVRVITIENSFFHHDCDVRYYEPPENVYGILAAPPCDQFSYARTNAKRKRNLANGLEIVKACMEIIWRCQIRIQNDQQKCPPLKFWALENPFFGSLKWFLGEPVTIFDPYEFGDGYKKRTALWGYFNKPEKNKNWIIKNDEKFDQLLMAEIIKLKCPTEDSGLAKNRKRLRSITPKGFAKAFYKANQ